MLINTDNLIEWLQEKIAILEVEKQASPFMDVKMVKSGKSKAFKECLDYIEAQSIPEPPVNRIWGDD